MRTTIYDLQVYHTLSLSARLYEAIWLRGQRECGSYIGNWNCPDSGHDWSGIFGRSVLDEHKYMLLHMYVR